MATDTGFPISRDNRATNAQALSLPDPVLVALSIPGIDPARFGAVIQAFGSLPNEGQVELANRLIEARDQYLYHRMSVCDATTRKGVLRSRLKDIGSAADRLLRLLHRDGADPQPWNAHPAATLALPQLCRTGSQHRPIQIWDPPQGLSLLRAMLADLAAVGAQAEAIFQARSPQKHGGSRREGPNPASGLVEQLIEIYETMRAQYPASGRATVFGKPLVKFVRAGLAFAVSTRTVWLDGTSRPSFEAAFMEADLPKPTRVTDDAIRGAFQRRRTQTEAK
jgi:hypothetical protein